MFVNIEISQEETGDVGKNKNKFKQAVLPLLNQFPVAAVTTYHKVSGLKTT